MSHANKLKLYPKKDEKHPKGYSSVEAGLEGARLEAGRLIREFLRSSRGDMSRK